MPLRVKCPTGHKLIVPDDRAGRSLRCPRCGQVTVVPGERIERPAAKSELLVAATHEAPAEEKARPRDSSNVLDWPNSIAPPTVVDVAIQELAAEAPPDPPLPAPSSRQPPPRLLPKPIIKPKSRALPS